MNFCDRYGFAISIASDQGSEFVNQIMTEMVKLTKLYYTVSAPYYPESHGRIERFNGILRKNLNLMSADQNKEVDWTTSLPFVLYSINRTINEKTGFSPFDLMYARPARSPFFNPPPPTLVETDVESWVEHLNVVTGPLRHLVNKRCIECNKKKNEVLNEQRRIDKLKVGQTVYRANVTRDDKSQVYSFGPYIIDRFDDRGNAYLKTARGVMIDKPHPHILLTRCTTDNKNQIIMWVERVVGESKVNNTIMYRMRYAGFDSDADEWHPDSPYARLQPAFQNYLVGKRLGHY